MSKSNAQRAARAHSKASGAPYASCRRWAEQGFLSNRKPLSVEPPHLHAEVAKLCSNATGTPLRDCLTWAEQGFLSKELSVPDGGSERQRSLEAFIANVLANALRDTQLDGVALGLVRVDPFPTQPVFHLQPEMAGAVVRELLPRYDRTFGGIRGVPGLRPAKIAGQSLVLHQLPSRASVQLRHPDPKWDSWLDSNKAGLRPLSKENPELLHYNERSELVDWLEEDNPHAHQWRQDRDRLLSRLLRRPGLLNIADRPHPEVNTYTHGYRDIIFEWCCGTETISTVQGLSQSGVHPPPMETGDVPIESLGILGLGDARAYLRCHSMCHLLADNKARHAR